MSLALANDILFDRAHVSEPRHELFEAQYWLHLKQAHSMAGGRGNVLFITPNANTTWVLRHYRRGGLIGKVIHDRYWWQGAEATRAFRELRLLAQLQDWGLPVPAPVAARYQRRGCLYQADLLTAAIAHSRTMARCLIEGELDSAMWQDIGRSIARFHARGVCHADLNANNILIDATRRVWLLDFDRGALRSVERAWIDAVLARLLRSLNKLRERQGLRFELADWQALVAAHDAALASSTQIT